MEIEPTFKKMPEHQVTYENVRDLILFGRFSPGHPITIQGLAEELNAGVTPIREAIRRLTAERALESLDNRRICVPIVTAEKLEELYFVREFIEPHLAAKSVIHLNKTDFKNLHINNYEVTHAVEMGDIPRYLEANYRFHFELYARAQSQTLCQIARSIWLQLAPALKVVFGRLGTSNLADKNNELLRHLTDRNSGSVHDTVKEELRHGKEIILRNMIK